MKDVMTPAPADEVRSVIKKCLENAALVNYTRISEQAKIEGILLFYLLLCIKIIRIVRSVVRKIYNWNILNEII